MNPEDILKHLNEPSDYLRLIDILKVSNKEVDNLNISNKNIFLGLRGFFKELLESMSDTELHEIKLKLL
ncbi:MAG: hypothetical protein DRG78_15360 [Epsilonproteobacteria bacterium]|nr:MAG: hypothetical protein DRG78_15360 [Campylobacterota bacterium]